MRYGKTHAGPEILMPVVELIGLRIPHLCEMSGTHYRTRECFIPDFRQR